MFLAALAAQCVTLYVCNLKELVYYYEELGYSLQEPVTTADNLEGVLGLTHVKITMTILMAMMTT